MILLLAACSPEGRTYTELIEPGGYAVFVDLRTIVVLPEGAVDDTTEPLEVHVTAEPGPGTLEATEAFAEVRGLRSARRFYQVELDVEEPLNQPMWVGRWDDRSIRDGVGGTLYTVVESPEGWQAVGHFAAPWIDVEPVLIHPDRAWFPTTSTTFLHGTAGTTSE